MIRRDYILRMIEEFFQVLSRIKSLKRAQQWEAAAGELEQEFLRLVGSGPEVVARLSETELLAALIRGEPTAAVHEKTLMLTALLKEAGDLAAGQGRAEESRSCYLKGLHLLLEEMARGEATDWPEFVPEVEAFALALRGSPLPLPTQAMLMHHYEATGQFAKAEDALFALLDTEPANAKLLDFGLAFYGRLEHQTDAQLIAGALPRPELEAGLAELRHRKAALSAQP
jgi:hypothetical protein